MAPWYFTIKQDLQIKTNLSSLYKLSLMICFLKTGGKFKWVDNWPLSFTKWGTEEPKNNYACVYMDVDRKWKTVSCTDTHYSLCKRSPGQAIAVLVLLQNIPHITKNYEGICVHVLFQIWLPLSHLSSLEAVQNQRSRELGYLSEATAIPFSAH